MLILLFPLWWTAACGQEPSLAPAGPASEAGGVPTPTGQPRTEELVDPVDGLLGNSLPGSWRPFADDSPWNTPIPADASLRDGSTKVLTTMTGHAAHLRFPREHATGVWVVDSPDLPRTRVRGDRIFDTWDADRDGWSDVGVPLDPRMWREPARDGNLCILDPARNVAWEMSRFEWPAPGSPTCTTFNVWDLTGSGCGHHDEGDRWQTRGGRGSGFPIIAGLLRPQEVEAGEIRHALTFTFTSIRRAQDGGDVFIAPPACRSDGQMASDTYPIEGMCFQLDPALTEADFDAWHLGPETRVVARALQTYGMYLGDRGGDWTIQVQLLSDDPSKHRDRWEERLPGLYSSIERIPTSAFRIVDRGGKEMVKP